VVIAEHCTCAVITTAPCCGHDHDRSPTSTTPGRPLAGAQHTCATRYARVTSKNRSVCRGQRGSNGPNSPLHENVWLLELDLSPVGAAPRMIRHDSPQLPGAIQHLEVPNQDLQQMIWPDNFLSSSLTRTRRLPPACVHNPCGCLLDFRMDRFRCPSQNRDLHPRIAGACVASKHLRIPRWKRLRAATSWWS
jgi:hypothetical protein